MMSSGVKSAGPVLTLPIGADEPMWIFRRMDGAVIDLVAGSR
ncbi:hypothetical protein [Nannocystis sp.]|nr:hypothetical protein [Nannocystis sp.]